MSVTMSPSALAAGVGIGRTYLVDNPLLQNVQLGIGFNSLLGQTLKPAVVGPSRVTSSTGSSQTVNYTLHICETSEDLDQALSLSASASYTAGFFGSVSGRLDFARRVSDHRYYFYLVVRCTVVNATTYLTDPVPGDALAKLVGGGPLDLEMFHKMFGDSFISSYQTGGEFVGVLRWATTTQSDRATVAAEVRGQFASGGFDVNTQARIANLRTSKNYDVFIYRNGDSGPAPDSSRMVEAALAFPQRVDAATGSPVIYQFATQDYAGVLASITLPSIANRLGRVRDYSALMQRLAVCASDLNEVPLSAGNKTKWTASVGNARSVITTAVQAIVNAPFNNGDAAADIAANVLATVDGLEFNLTRQILKTTIVPTSHGGDADWPVPGNLDTRVTWAMFYIDGDKMRGIQWTDSDGNTYSYGDLSQYPYELTPGADRTLNTCSIRWTQYGYQAPLQISLTEQDSQGRLTTFDPGVYNGSAINLDAQVKYRVIAGFCGARNPDNFMQSIGLYTGVIPRVLPL